MKRLVLFMFVIMLAFSVTAAYAGDGCSKEVKKACASEKTKKSCAATCASKAKGDGEAKAAGEVKEVKEAHVCPEVAKGALHNFHEVMHPMHVAIGESNFDAVRSGQADLMKASKAVSEYKCDGYDKCSDKCRTNFDGQKTALTDAVAALVGACKGEDNEKVTSAFDTMHEAYISFANTCVHPEKTSEEAPKIKPIKKVKVIEKTTD